MSVLRQEADMKELGPLLSEALDLIYGQHMGFALLWFTFNDDGVGNYLSNASREDMIKALRETADRLEQNQDIPSTKGSA